MKRDELITNFENMAREFRKQILNTIFLAKSGHPGGSLSLVEILITLYFYKMKHNPANPDWEDRDRLILSKGHASPAIYVTLANAGYFPLSELKNFRKLGSILQGHIHPVTPGIEHATGYLGQGLSVANGIAIGAKLLGKNFKVYCILGDGEMQEGNIWEALMTSAHHKLDNLCAILDANGVQENGLVREIKNEEPLFDRIEAFGWNVYEINGHSFEEIMQALDKADSEKGKPTFIIARTIKGKGVSFMENQHIWHGKAPKEEDLKKALIEIEKGYV
ncbi:MAG: transketolase [Brevinematia bacterium]